MDDHPDNMSMRVSALTQKNLDGKHFAYVGHSAMVKFQNKNYYITLFA